VLLKQLLRNTTPTSTQSSKTTPSTSNAKFFEYNASNEQEFSLTKTYKGPPFPNNDFALALFVKIYGKSKSKDKTNAAISLPAQSANLAKTDNWCFYPLCRGRNKYAAHTWKNCHRNRHSAHSKQQSSNRNRASGDQTKSSFSTNSGHSQKQDNHSYKLKSKKHDQFNVKNDTNCMMEGLKRNKNGVFASPAVHQMSSADKKNSVPELQRALAVKNIAANFVSSGNQED
jgi:hypothetical protein